MAIKKLFNSSVQSENRTYLLIRDNSEYAKEKDFIEDGWIKLVKYLDPDFEKKINVFSCKNCGRSIDTHAFPLSDATSSGSCKNCKRQEYISKGIVKPDEMFVIGINGFRLRKWSESDPPYIVKSVLGIGNYFSIISLKRLEAINDG